MSRNLQIPEEQIPWSLHFETGMELFLTQMAWLTIGNGDSECRNQFWVDHPGEFLVARILPLNQTLKRSVLLANLQREHFSLEGEFVILEKMVERLVIDN